MTKSKTTNENVAATLSQVGEQVQSPSLTPAARQQLRGRNANVPDELIEMIRHLAEQGGGSVLGMPFDATAATTTLAQTASARTAIRVGRQTIQRMEDDMLQQRATVADPAFAIYTSLRRLVKTKAGNSLSAAYEQMKSIVKNRPRKSRKKTAEPASPPATATAAATAPATPAPSAQAPAVKASATTSTS
jgi:hypothetical protein